MKYVTPIERMAKEEGRVATQTAIVLNMLRKNMSLESIAEIIGLAIK
jgi:hypothetical protein